MVRRWFQVAVAVAVAYVAVGSRADEFGPEIDLTAFEKDVIAESSVWDGIPIHEVARERSVAANRFYLSGMIGPSFASVSSPDDDTLVGDDTLFAAGGALGIAFERANGRWRLETEGMGRSTFEAPCAEPSPCTTVFTSNWSVMENLWRDFMLTERFGVYGGGGIGVGGYTYGDSVGAGTVYADPGASFAWQFGGGLLWQLSDRLTFDVGYRYFQIDPVSLAATPTTRFNASELMFTLRLFEPFRGLRR